LFPPIARCGRIAHGLPFRRAGSTSSHRVSQLPLGENGSILSDDSRSNPKLRKTMPEAIGIASSATVKPNIPAGAAATSTISANLKENKPMTFLQRVDACSGGQLGAALQAQLEASVGKPQPTIEISAAFRICVETNEEQLAAARLRPALPGTELAWSVPTIGSPIPTSAANELKATTAVNLCMANYPGNKHTPELFLDDFRSKAAPAPHPSLQLLARTPQLAEMLVAAAMETRGVAGYGAEVKAIKSSARQTLRNGGISNPSLPLLGHFFTDITSATPVGAGDLNKARNPAPAPCRPPA